MAIAVLLMGLAVPSLTGQVARRKLQESYDRLNGLVSQARERSMREGKPYLLAWNKEGVVSLYPADLNNDERKKQGATATLFPDKASERYTLVPAQRADHRPLGGMDVLAVGHLRAGHREVRRERRQPMGSGVQPALGTRRADPVHRAMRTPPPMKHSRSRHHYQGGFLLLEIILATMIFALGVLALGRCLTVCLTAQAVRVQEERARTALENRMAEVQASPTLPDELHRTQLKGSFAGLTMTERRRTLDLKNENNVPLDNLHEITLTAEWTGPGGQRQSRAVAFDLLRGR